MDTTVIMKLFEMGSMAVLAFVMFHFYRMDRKASETTIKELATDFKEALKAVVESIDTLATERARK